MIGPEIQAPDLTEAVIGYRRFNLELRSQHNYHLVSPHTSEPWPTVERTARCNKTISSERVVLDGIRPKAHSAPQKDCGCGIYAYFEPCPISERTDRYMHMNPYSGPAPTEVEALVSVTGRIEVHARGLRAQRARICALGMNSTLSGSEREGLAAIAALFGVPVVPQAELPRIASEFGGDVPASLRPEPPSPQAAQTDAPVGGDPFAPMTTRRRLAPPRWAIALNGSLGCLNAGLIVAFHGWYNVAALMVSTGYAAWMAGRRRELTVRA